MYEKRASTAVTTGVPFRDEVSDWLKRMTPEQSDNISRYAATLTLDIETMHRKFRGGLLESKETIALAKSTFSAFRWKLDRTILKSAASKYGRELDYIPVIEGQSNGHRIHYHCVIVTPAWVTLPDMKAAVKHAWLRTELGGQQVDVQAMRDDGWLQYISKEAWTVARDVVDIDNVRLSTRPERC